MGRGRGGVERGLQPEQRRPGPAPRREREKQPDPNSPFAKLLALKQQLEGKGPGDKKGGD